MKRRTFLKLAGAAAAVNAAKPVLGQSAPVSGIMQPVLKRGYDLANTGANLKETVFTVAGIKAKGIRTLFTLPMEGDARGSEAQPLIVPSVLMDDGNIRDICITASMNNTLWCYDANSSDDLWMKKLAVAVNGSSAIDGWKIDDHWGLLSTPVIDQAAGVLYCVSWQSPDATYQRGMHYLHSIKLKDGSRLRAPIDLANTTYQAPGGILESYNTALRKQRCSLTLATIGGRKTVIWAAGTVAETSSVASGWIFAYDIECGSYTAITLSDSNYGAGVWQAGSSLSVDSKGFIYGVSGNGAFDGTGSFGECAFKAQYTPPTTACSTTGTLIVASAAKLQIVDWFSPWTDAQREGAKSNAVVAHDETKLAGVQKLTLAPAMKAMMAALPNSTSNPGYDDQDLGSAPGALIESLDLFMMCGKDGVVYPVNSTNMGKTSLADVANPTVNYAKLKFLPQWWTFYPGNGVSAMPQVPANLDVLYAGKTHHQHSSPVQYLSKIHGQMVFICGENGPVRAWSVTATGQTFLAQSNEIASAQVTAAGGGMPGGFMCLSANGQVAGTAVLWVSLPFGDANKTVTNGRLVAYDAENFVNGVMQVLWDSEAEGIAYIFDKFCPPVVSGGKVFLATYADETMVLG